MANKILVSSDVFSKLWMTPDALQIFAFLLHIADDNGDADVDDSRISTEAKLSCKRVEGGLRLLRDLNIISRKSTKKIHIQAAICEKQRPLTVTSASPIVDEYSSFADAFNEKVKGTAIPRIRGLSDARIKTLKSRVKEYGSVVVLEIALNKAVDSDFLSGRKTDFFATFDWIFKKANFLKILEGNYDNTHISTISRDTPASRKERRDRGLSLANQIVSGSENLISLYNGSGEGPNTGKN